MGLANISGLIKPLTKVTLKMVSSMGRASGSVDLSMIIWASDAISTMETIFWTGNMAMVNLNGSLGTLTRASTRMMREKAMA